MLIFIVFVFVMILFVSLFLYLKPVAAIHLKADGSCSVISVKPYKKFRRSISGSYSSSVVKITDGYSALFVDIPDTDVTMSYKDFSFRSDVYIFRSSLFKFKSVSLNDRTLIDCVSKFNFNKYEV